MQASDVPQKLPIPFAANAGGGFIRDIPVASQIGVVDGAASLSDGFPPATFQPIAAGGTPPSGKDMNGILYEISGWARWVAAGGPIYFDPDFAALIGGYPRGAAVRSSGSPAVVFVSTADGNVTNPEADTAANWVVMQPVPATLAELRAGDNATKYVTAATLAQLRASIDDLIAGEDTVKYVTPRALALLRATSADYRDGTDAVKYLTPASIAQGSGEGVILQPGGNMQQFGSHVQQYTSGLYTLPFNAPFSRVDAVLVTGLHNTSNFGASQNTWPKWNKVQTTLAQFVFAVVGVYGSSQTNVLDGISWVAYGRS